VFEGLVEIYGGEIDRINSLDVVDINGIRRKM
jgi:hypothetical protein